MRLHNPVGVGRRVASHTHGSKSQGKEKIAQDAPDDDQQVDPSLKGKDSKGSEYSLVVPQSGKICSF